MKKATLVAGLILSLNVSAGTAFIPKFTTAHNGTWCVSISNISNVDSSVTVKAYKSEGVLYTGAAVTNDIPSQFNTPFTLLPNQTTLLCAKNVSGGSEHGYAVINSNAVNSDTGEYSRLIAHAYYHPSSSPSYSRAISVNGGQPF